MNSLFLTLMCTLLLSPVTDSSFPTSEMAKVKWQKFTSSDGRFSLSFPGQFADDEQPSEGFLTQTIQCEFNQVLYMAACTTHESEIEQTEGIADVTLTAFATELGSKVLAKEDYVYKKLTGKKATLQMADGQWVTYRLLFDGRYQYQIMVIGEQANLDKAIADKFFASLKIK